MAVPQRRATIQHRLLGTTSQEADTSSLDFGTDLIVASCRIGNKAICGCAVMFQAHCETTGFFGHFEKMFHRSLP